MSICRQSSTFFLTTYLQQGHKARVELHISFENTTFLLQSVSKKMSFLGKTAITTFKLIQNAKVGGVLENSGYLLPDGHWDFQNWRRNDWENEA